MNIDRPCLDLSRIKYNTVGCSFKRESWMDVRSFWWILCVKNESCTLASIKIGRLKRQLTSSAPYQLECDQRQHALNDFFFFVATYLQKKVCDSQFLINGTAAIVDCWFISGSLLLLLSPLESEHFFLLTTRKKKIFAVRFLGCVHYDESCVPQSGVTNTSAGLPALSTAHFQMSEMGDGAVCSHRSVAWLASFYSSVSNIFRISKK